MQVCATLEASNNLVRRPDGSLPPEADPSKTGVGVAVDPAVANPDQARIQSALDACGAAVDKEVGAAIAAADAAAVATNGRLFPIKTSPVSAVRNWLNQYRGSKFAVRLVVNSKGG
jgi:hypothetical protein